MLLEQAANRLQAYLMQKFSDYTRTSTGLCLPYKPRAEAETALYEHGTDNRITLNDGYAVQFIIRGTGGNYDPIIPSPGTSQHYRSIGKLYLIVYTSENDVPELVQSALTALKEVRVTRFIIEPQEVARLIFLEQDFNFERPLVAFEIDLTERVKPVACTTLPVAVCAPVEFYVNGVFQYNALSGSAILHTQEAGGGTVIIEDQNGTEIAEVEAPGIYPVFAFDRIQNSLTSSTVITNTF